MDSNQIKDLLAKYYDGVTSLEEERMLQEYFAGEHEIPDGLVSSGLPFMLYKAAADDKPDPADLESRIAASIDNQVRIMQPVNQRKISYRFLIAASFALLIGVSGILIYRHNNAGPQDTFKDPVAAYSEAQKTLLYVSQKMNQGMKPLSHVAAISTGTDKLKSLEKMDESLGMLNLVSFINKSSNLKK